MSQAHVPFRKPEALATYGELDAFKALCHKAYFDQDSHALALLEQTVREHPLSERGALTKAQNAVRVEWHRHVEGQRQHRLAAALSEIKPGFGETEAMRSSIARRERQRGLEHFLRCHAHRSRPGTHPFLRSLYAVLQIQCGAGCWLVQWDVDEAIFMEASSEDDFLMQSVNLLICVLGMEHHLKDSSGLPNIARTEKELSEPLIGPSHREDAQLPHRRSLLSQPRIRTFTLPPYLTNPELEYLALHFPQWVASNNQLSDDRAIEEGRAGGHGQIRISERPRDAGFEGGAMERFVVWLMRLLYLS